MEAHEHPHAAEVGPVDHPAPVALRPHETGGVERGEVKGQAGGRNAKRRGDLAGCTTLGVCPEQKAEDAQAMGMSQRAEAANGAVLVHVSTLLELSNHNPGRRP